MKYVFFMILTALTVASAFATSPDSDWIELSRDSGQTLSVSVSSLEHKGEYADIRAKLVNAPPRDIATVSFPVDRMISQVAIDCANHKPSFGRTTVYGVSTGQTYTVDDGSDFYRDYNSGSVADLIIKFACSNSSGTLRYVPAAHAMVCNIPVPDWSSQARRLEHEGRVVVAYLRKASGAISDVRIEVSSGHDELDQAAMKSMKGALCESREGGWDQYATQAFVFKFANSKRESATTRSRRPEDVSE
ncbi:energy transducer TonB [Burkholderia territorii]|uniref:energy transducer TonB n=1 Tax=Burkholderia territorii TaxID=1503055 RepID=UPI0009C09CF5|nr:TonB family protein [Burkholderia territorii]